MTRPLATAERHLHRIEVDTESEAVHVTVGEEGRAGSPGYVAGGFGKFFNRIIDNGIWAELPDAARTVYLPLVRLADGRGPFRVRAGLAALMKLSGLSRSSVKRGLKALQDHRLIVVVEAGGVGADNVNRANCYELVVPEPRDDAAPRPQKAQGPVQRRTPSRSTPEPAPRSPANRPSVQAKAEPGSGRGPQSKKISKTSPPRPGGGSLQEQAEPEADRLVASLGIWGVPVAEAATWLAEHGSVAVERALADARRMHARGELRSAAGYLRWSLAERAQAPAPPPSGEAVWQRREVERRRTEEATAAGALDADDALLDRLEDDELAVLADAVLANAAEQPGIVRLLTLKPPRQSRLMRAEIVKLLRDGGLVDATEA